MEDDNNGGHQNDNGNGTNTEKYCNNTRFLGDTVEQEEEDDDDDEEILKRRISSHPLYGRLIETHLNCLKVGLGAGAGEIGTTTYMDGLNQTKLNFKPNIPTSSELDHFMEAYCITLKKLKEAMEEPVKETTTFMDEMYVQLRGLCEREKETKPIHSKSNSPTY